MFAPPSFNPVNGSMVGVAKPIIINFARPIANRPMAEQAIHIFVESPVPGAFYWTTDSQVRWRPFAFWPAGTQVSIDASLPGRTSGRRLAGGDKSTTRPPDDDHPQQQVEDLPGIDGQAGRQTRTKNSTYYVLEKFADIVMDSSTYGVPVQFSRG